MPRTALLPAPPSATSLTPHAMRALLRDLAADPGRWRPHLPHDTRGRSWVRLHPDDLAPPDAVDVWLLTWQPGTATELHDHGGAAAALTVLQGAVEEVRADAYGRLTTHVLPPGQERWMPAGAVHDVRGSGSEPAVSLHAYSPRLRSMTFYDRQLRPLRTEHTSEPER